MLFKPSVKILSPNFSFSDYIQIQIQSKIECETVSSRYSIWPIIFWAGYPNYVKNNSTSLSVDDGGNKMLRIFLINHAVNTQKNGQRNVLRSLNVKSQPDVTSYFHLKNCWIADAVLADWLVCRSTKLF